MKISEANTGKEIITKLGTILVSETDLKDIINFGNRDFLVISDLFYDESDLYSVAPRTSTQIKMPMKWQLKQEIVKHSPPQAVDPMVPGKVAKESISTNDEWEEF